MKKYLIPISLLMCLIGCDTDIVNKLKEKFRNSNNTELIEKSQLNLYKNNCNDQENKQLVLDMVQEEFNKQVKTTKELFILNPTYTMVSTQEKTDLKTTCNARIIYSYPKDIENISTVNIDVDYFITKNELKENGYIVTLFNQNLSELIDFQNKYKSKKEDFLFEKMQIKKINIQGRDISNDDILYSTYKDALKLNDWNENVKGNSCFHENSSEVTICTYKFIKNSYEVTVDTKRKDECFFCAKKAEIVIKTHINEL